MMISTETRDKGRLINNKGKGSNTLGPEGFYGQSASNRIFLFTSIKILVNIG